MAATRPRATGRYPNNCGTECRPRCADTKCLAAAGRHLPTNVLPDLEWSVIWPGGIYFSRTCKSIADADKTTGFESLSRDSHATFAASYASTPRSLVVTSRVKRMTINHVFRRIVDSIRSLLFRGSRTSCGWSVSVAVAHEACVSVDDSVATRRHCCCCCCCTQIRLS